MDNKNLHRNSQKRIYGEGYIYFITTNTYRRFPYFREETFCELFIDSLKICKELKKFKLYGFVVLPEHVHLLIEPGEEYNISQVMQALKKNISQDVNKVIGFYPEGENSNSRLRKVDVSIYKYNKFVNFPKFQWHQSYYDHIIRDEDDFRQHTEYIWWNPEKHGIIDNWQNYKYSSYYNYQNLIDYLNI